MSSSASGSESSDAGSEVQHPSSDEEAVAGGGEASSSGRSPKVARPRGKSLMRKVYVPEDIPGSTTECFDQLEDQSLSAADHRIDLSCLKLSPTRLGLKHRAYELPTEPGLSPFEMYSQCLERTVSRVRALPDSVLYSLFSYETTSLEKLLGLYMNNLTDLYARLMRSNHPTRDSIAAVVSSASIVVNRFLPDFINAGCGHPTPGSYVNVNVAKLVSYWGAPAEANNAMFHVLTRPVLFSLKPDEKEVGGAPLKDDTTRSFSVFQALSGLSYLILTVRGGEDNDVYVPVDYHSKHANTDNPVKYVNANKDAYIICMPCITFPRAGVVNDAVTDACKKVLGPLGVQPLPVFTRKELSTCKIYFQRESGETSIRFVGRVGCGHTLAVNSGCNYLMRPPTKYKHTHSIKEWLMTGGRLDTSRTEDSRLPTAAFAAASRKYLNEKQPFGESEFVFGDACVPIVKKGGEIVSNKFANIFFSRNGTFTLSDGSLLAPEILYDPPVMTREGALMLLVSAGWEVTTARWMTDPRETTKGPLQNIWKSTLSQLTSYCALKCLGLLRQDACLRTIRVIPQDMLKQLTSSNCKLNVKAANNTTDLAIFSRGRLYGPLPEADLSVFKHVALITNPHFSINHGTLARSLKPSSPLIKPSSSSNTTAASSSGKNAALANTTLTRKRPHRGGEDQGASKRATSPGTAPRETEKGVVTTEAYSSFISISQNEDTDEVEMEVQPKKPPVPPPPQQQQSRSKASRNKPAQTPPPPSTIDDGNEEVDNEDEKKETATPSPPAKKSKNDRKRPAEPTKRRRTPSTKKKPTTAATPAPTMKASDSDSA